MKTTDVPQHAVLLGEFHEVCYAQDETGRLVPVPSAGWEPANVANIQAWQQIAEQVEAVLAEIRGGTLSPLAYHMERHQMDVGMLSAYTGLSRWTIRRHRRAGVFRRLSDQALEPYARVFRVAPEELRRVPEDAGVAIPGGGRPVAP